MFYRIRKKLIKFVYFFLEWIDIGLYICFVKLIWGGVGNFFFEIVFIMVLLNGLLFFVDFVLLL